MGGGDYLQRSPLVGGSTGPPKDVRQHGGRLGRHVDCVDRVL